MSCHVSPAAAHYIREREVLYFHKLIMITYKRGPKHNLPKLANSNASSYASLISRCCILKHNL